MFSLLLSSPRMVAVVFIRLKLGVDSGVGREGKRESSGRFMESERHVLLPRTVALLSIAVCILRVVVVVAEVGLYRSC